MIIGFDITMLAYQGSGVANYTYNFVRNLLTYDKKNEYKFFYSSFRKPENLYHLDELKKAGGKVYIHSLPHKLLRIIWNKLHILPIEWLIGEVDIFFHQIILDLPCHAAPKV